MDSLLYLKLDELFNVAMRVVGSNKKNVEEDDGAVAVRKDWLVWPSIFGVRAVVIGNCTVLFIINGEENVLVESDYTVWGKNFLIWQLN